MAGSILPLQPVSNTATVDLDKLGVSPAVPFLFTLIIMAARDAGMKEGRKYQHEFYSSTSNRLFKDFASKDLHVDL